MSIRCGVSRKMTSARNVRSSSQPPEAATGMVSPWPSAGADTVHSLAPTPKVSELAGSMRVIWAPPAPGAIATELTVG